MHGREVVVGVRHRLFPEDQEQIAEIPYFLLRHGEAGANLLRDGEILLFLRCSFHDARRERVRRDERPRAVNVLDVEHLEKQLRDGFVREAEVLGRADDADGLDGAVDVLLVDVIEEREMIRVERMDFLREIHAMNVRHDDLDEMVAPFHLRRHDADAVMAHGLELFLVLFERRAHDLLHERLADEQRVRHVLQDDEIFLQEQQQQRLLFE